jgi:hypothetical protein
MGEPTNRTGPNPEILSSPEEERRLEGIRKAKEVEDGTEAVDKTPDAAIAEQSEQKTGLEFGPKEEIKDGVQQLKNVDVKEEETVALSRDDQEKLINQMISGGSSEAFDPNEATKHLPG